MINDDTIDLEIVIDLQILTKRLIGRFFKPVVD